MRDPFYGVIRNNLLIHQGSAKLFCSVFLGHETLYLLPNLDCDDGK
jgi:hypothetical protein